jgi:alanyl-tRNA synthetase
MQHHSAQHILSGALEKLLGLETLSVKIRADTPSTLDVPLREISQVDWAGVERLANDILFENRPIKSYFITDDQIDTVPFRRPPQVKGQIRVVEVDDFDYSACGGTHCPYTGMIGLIKILKTEHKNKKLRLHFTAGHQALRYFQTYHALVTEIGRTLSTAPEDIGHIISQQIEQLQEAQREIKKLRREALSFEAQQLISQAEQAKAYRLVIAILAERPAHALRELGKLLQREADVIGAVASYDGQKLLLVVSCGDCTNVSARQLLASQLDQIGGQGGGDARIAQGGGPATEQQAETFFDSIHDHILAARK